MREGPSTEQVRLAATLIGSLTEKVAFLGGAALDLLFSRDLSDVITLFDGRPTVPDEIQTADDPLRTFLGTTLRWCLEQEAFLDAISANLPPDHISQSRQAAILQRIQAAVHPN